MQYDVAVVGTGPAGATAARELALHGVSVVMLEKESLPRYKVCGGGIAFRARSLLDFDIAPVVRSECHVAMLSLANTGISYTATRAQPVVSMVMRSEFDQLLVKHACEAGAELIEQCTVESASFSASGVALQTSVGVISAAVVVAADGATSTMARLAGWERLKHMGPALECELDVSAADYQRFEEVVRLDFGMPGNGYAWVFPKGGHLSVGIGRFGTGGRKDDLKKALRVYLNDLNLPLPDESDVHGYVIPLLPRQDGFVKNRVFLVGDAAGLCDPVSAEGISAAIISGRLAAKALISGKLDVDHSKQAYEGELKTLLQELDASRKLAGLFYSSHTLRKWLLKRFGQRITERVADVFMGQVHFRDYADSFMKRIKLSRLETGKRV